MSFTPTTKKNIRNIGGLGVAGLAAVLLFAPTISTASYTASSSGTAEAVAGKLSLTATDDAGSVGNFKLKFDNLAPGGDAKHDTLYVTNTGSVVGYAKVTFGKGTLSGGSVVGSIGSKPNPDYLVMGINGITSLTPFQKLSATDVGAIAPGETAKIVFDGALLEAAGNEYQGVKGVLPTTITLDSSR